MCDGCGARLEPEERLWGLCPACLEPPQGTGQGK